ncbi:hypothetical protein F5Y14DRAFT_315219 [Nemania sp. NC0429]|nr:hypothetical protein F5Y14DRAFT_315219 [Nemania sp. NC0429]
MKTSIPGDILVFTGQGSKKHLSDRSTLVGLEKQLGDSKSVFQLFLKRCLKAYHAEYLSLNEQERLILGSDDSWLYEDADALLFPPEANRSHPVSETIALYLHQILELYAFAVQSDAYPRIVEVTGVCTGLLSAVLAASTLSYESEEFFDAAVDGFRLAFWIGLRSKSASHDVLDDRPEHPAWVLSTFGWSTSQLQTALSQFYSQQQEDPDHLIQISAIFSDDVHSLSGPGSVLANFKSTTVPSSIQCRPAHIHGLYHGGSRMDAIVSEVLNDVERRNINFPKWDTLHAPLRSSTTGARTIKGSGCMSLLETVLRGIFVELCDWRKTCENLFDDTLRYLEHDSKAGFRVRVIGPGAKFLVQGAPTHERLRVIDNLSDLVEGNTEDMVAIVGMSLNYPGANSNEQLWDMLENARCTASKIPSSRFDAPATLNQRLGNFIEDPFQFDPGFFNISPREAKSMDPQQRLLLQAALEALQDSGYSPNSTPTFQKDSFGVFVGVATNDYVDNLRQDIDVYYSPGTLRAFLSGRISYAFDFLGPSLVIDTACSSSTVALHQACRALRSGECTAALAGGVNTISSPDMYSGLARAHFLSPAGQCKPFDAAADGYSRAEGCGLVVLKKLSDAIKENDHVYGIIRGIGVNQCGTAKSITHPDHNTQAALFRQLLSSSRTDPNTINVVEAHGTGTQAGDYAEVLSLSTTFGPRTASNPLHLSSIKGNIGHAEAASGLAGLAKLLMMIEKGKIPPQASFKLLNPRLAGNIHNMLIPTEPITWKPAGNHSPRRAMLNNFGAAGSNAALILEEYVPKSNAGPAVNKSTSTRSYHVMNLSAKSEKALQSLKDRLISYIEGHAEINEIDLSYTANARRQLFTGFRLSVTGSNAKELADSLRKSASSQIDSTKNGPRKTIFVFSGQGHAHIGMGAEMLSTVPEFRRIVDNCDRILSENGFPIVSSFISDSHDQEEGESSEGDIIVTQCALFVLEFAIARTWIQWGVTPDVVVGHSIGEYAALAIAGILDLKDALLLCARRAELIATRCESGMSGMVTCRANIDAINSLVGNDNTQFPDISIACLNGQEDIVVAGPIESLTRFIEHCSGNGIKAKQLKVPFGFHSSSMDPILGDLDALVSSVALHESSVVVGSSLQGKVLDLGQSIPADYFSKHTRNPVNFCKVLQDVEESFPGTNLDFIEIGPSPSTEPMIRKNIKKAPCTFLPSLKPTEKSWETLSNSLSALFLRNQSVKWREVYHGTSAKFLTSFPKYPMNTSRYYIQFQEQQEKKPELREEVAKPSFEFLGPNQPTVSERLTSFHSNMAPLAPYIKAHSVAGIPLCPASVLIEVAFEALNVSKGASSTGLHLVEDVVFEKPLVYEDRVGNEHSLQTDLDMNVGEKTRFSLSSNNQLHCYGHITHKSPNSVVDIFTRKSALVKRQRRTLYEDLGGAFDSFSSKTIYQVIFPRVVAYDKPFLTLKHLSVSESRLEGSGTFRLDSSLLQNGFVCHPAFLDTLLHAPGFIANIYVPADIACICIGIERAYLPDSQHLKGGDMTIYCSLTDLGHSVIADAYVLNSEDKVVAFIEGACFKKIPLKSFTHHLSRSLRAPANKAAPIPTPTPTQKAVDPPTPNIEETIRSIVQECSGVSLDPSSDVVLEQAGIDSLLFIEIIRSIRDRLPQVKIDEASLEACSTLQELVGVVSKAFPRTPSPDVPATESHSNDSPKAQEPIRPLTSVPSSAEGLSPIKSLLFDTCGIDIEPGTMDIPLGALGVDSLLSIELTDELRDKFGFILDESQFVISELTFTQLEEIFMGNNYHSNDASSSPSSQASTGPSTVDTIPSPEPTALSLEDDFGFQRTIQRQIDGDHKCNIYMFHDGSGYCNMYSRMSSINRNVTGIFSPDPSAEIQRLEDLASLYIKQTKLDNDKEVLLAGWSFGGVLAFEVSRQLQSLGHVVKGLILVDSPPPINHEPLPQEIVSYVTGSKTTGETADVAGASKQARERLSKRFQYHATLLQNYHPDPRTDNVPCVMLKCSRSMDTETLCNVAYPWISDDEFRNSSVAQWEQLLGRSIPVLDIDCNHFEVFDTDYVHDVSEKMMLACQMLE